MRKDGHIGFSLLVLSLIQYIHQKFGVPTLLTVEPVGLETFLSTAIFILASLLPDIDLKLGIAHRKYTHNVLFALLLGMIGGSVLLFAGLDYYLGFTAAFLGVISHLSADMLTRMPFAPLWPISGKKVKLGLVSSGNTLVNEGFLVLGSVSYFYIYYTMLVLQRGIVFS